MLTKGYLSEVFASVQGEGMYVGCYQLFIRLAGCVFDCPYCDTDFTAKECFSIEDDFHANPIYPNKLADIILEKYGNLSIFHSISVTGGEPLLQPLFVEDLLTYLKPNVKCKFFIETSGLVVDELDRFDKLADIFSVDIKMHDEMLLDNLPQLLSNLKSLQFASYYLKLLLADNVNFALLDKVISELKRAKVPSIIIQPIDNIIRSDTISEVMARFHKKGVAVRIIPQLHKLLNVR